MTKCCLFNENPVNHKICQIAIGCAWEDEELHSDAGDSSDDEDEGDDETSLLARLSVFAFTYAKKVHFPHFSKDMFLEVQNETCC